jgi:hypothetical protein
MPNIPEDLIGLRRRRIAVTAELAAFTATLPSALAMVSGEAELTPDARDAWNRLHDEQADLAVQISGHPWLAAAENRALADEALTKVAVAVG